MTKPLAYFNLLESLNWTSIEILKERHIMNNHEELCSSDAS